MSFIREENSVANITYCYKLDYIQSNIDAVCWLSEARNITGLFTKYISFDDFLNRSDEGSDDIQFDSQVSTEELKQNLQNRRVDLISITGKYLDKPIIIGLNLSNYEIYLTIRKIVPADIKQIEKLLNLV